MTVKYKKQILRITNDWIVHRNEFYDIDPLDEIPEDDKFFNIYSQEDLLLIQKGQFYIDLGWYGHNYPIDLKNQMTGFMLVLYKGQDLNNCELLELIRTKSKSEIASSINRIVELVNVDFYNGKTGYIIDENDTEYRHIGQHFQYSVSRNLNELME